MPRFVLLDHQSPPRLAKPRHWDFMLEDNGALLTWALAECPSENAIAASPIPATRLPDHRLAYLDYEGPVSRDRGEVCRVEAGTFAWLQRQEKLCRVQLAGAHLQGVATLAQVDDRNWTFTFASRPEVDAPV